MRPSNVAASIEPSLPLESSGSSNDVVGWDVLEGMEMVEVRSNMVGSVEPVGNKVEMNNVGLLVSLHCKEG
jgi:hypothetical protein